MAFWDSGGTVPYSPKCYLSTRAQVCESVFNLKLKRKQKAVRLYAIYKVQKMDIYICFENYPQSV